MMWFVARRLAGLVATLAVAAGLIFGVSSLAPVPGGRDSTQFLGWLGGVVVGEFGRSNNGGTAIGPMIAGGLGVTVPLALLAMLVAALLGGGLAWLATRRPDGVFDRMVSALIGIGAAVPTFWLGLLLVLLFAVGLHWLPAGGFMPWRQNVLGALGSLILPAVVVALPKAAVLARSARAALGDVQRSGYVQAARGRGLTEQEALRRFGLRNVAAALLRPLAIEASTLVGATLIVENVFYLPGLGQLIFNGVLSSDVALVRAGVLILVLLLSGTMFLVRLFDGWIDPRMRTAPLW